MFGRILTLVLICGFAQILGAATSTWTGNAGNQNWQESANWDNGVPGASDGALFNINAGTAALPVVNVPPSLQRITVTAGAVVYLRAPTAVTLTTDPGLDVNTGAVLHLMDGPSFNASIGVVVNGGAILVRPGGTLTINGDLHVFGSGARFGAHEDGTDSATAGLAATINYNGNVRVDVPDGLELGEGIHNFGGLLDFGFTADMAGVVLMPQRTDNDVAPEIHLVNNHPTQELRFNTGGSAFFVTSVGAGTRVTQFGRMILAGDFDVSAAASPSAFTVWGGGADVVIGTLDMVLAADLTTNNGRVEWGDVLVRQAGGAAAPATVNDRPRITVRTGTTGKFVMETLTLEGDTYNNFNNQNENNSPEVVLDHCTLEVTDELILEDGDNDADPTGTGGGATLTMLGGTLRAFILQLGDNSAANADEGVRFSVSGNATIELLNNGILDARPHSVLFADESLITGVDVLTISVISSAARLELRHCTVRGVAANKMAVMIGSQDLRVLATEFVNYNLNGVAFAAGTTIKRFDENKFTNGQAGGSHITFNGLGNGAKIDCDGNLFDGSTQPFTGHGIVRQNVAGNLVNFRVSGTNFGHGGFTLDRTTAEAQDDDNGLSDATQVAWYDSVSTLYVTPLTAPIQIEHAISDGVGNQSAMLFNMQVSSGAAVINSLRVTFTGLTEDITAADIGYVTLFVDLDGNGAYTNGEAFSGTGSLDSADEPLTGNFVVFDLAGIGVSLANRTITAPDLVRWGLAITFLASGAGHGGLLRLRIDIGDIDDDNGNIVGGLPIENVLQVTGPVHELVMIQQPTSTPVDAIIAPAPVVELRDAAGRPVRARTYNVTASLHQGPTGAALSGTLAAASSTFNARATFSSLRLNRVGNNYILRFTAQAKTCDTVVFEVTSVTPPGPGPLKGRRSGCAAAQEGIMPGLIIPAVLVALWLVRRRHGKEQRGLQS